MSIPTKRASLNDNLFHFLQRFYLQCGIWIFECGRNIIFQADCHKTCWSRMWRSFWIRTRSDPCSMGTWANPTWRNRPKSMLIHGGKIGKPTCGQNWVWQEYHWDFLLWTKIPKFLQSHLVRDICGTKGRSLGEAKDIKSFSFHRIEHLDWNHWKNNSKHE